MPTLKQQFRTTLSQPNGWIKGRGEEFLTRAFEWVMGPGAISSTEEKEGGWSETTYVRGGRRVEVQVMSEAPDDQTIVYVRWAKPRSGVVTAFRGLFQPMEDWA